jgi:hypothetical protein
MPIGMPYKLPAFRCTTPNGEQPPFVGDAMDARTIGGDVYVLTDGLSSVPKPVHTPVNAPAAKRCSQLTIRRKRIIRIDVGVFAGRTGHHG